MSVAVVETRHIQSQELFIIDERKKQFNASISAVAFTALGLIGEILLICEGAGLLPIPVAYAGLFGGLVLNLIAITATSASVVFNKTLKRGLKEDIEGKITKSIDSARYAKIAALVAQSLSFVGSALLIGSVFRIIPTVVGIGFLYANLCFNAAALAALTVDLIFQKKIM